jgi:hypothetical protein
MTDGASVGLVASPLGGFGKMFNEDLWGKIAATPSLRAHMNEPDFVEKVRCIIADPMSLQMYVFCRVSLTRAHSIHEGT